MTQPRFLQIHWLTSYPATLLNRDDSGLAKRLPFGKAVRTRISSQCLKRHCRMVEDECGLSAIGPEMAVRSRDTPERLAQYLPVFNADILGLTGDDAVIRTIISEYGGEYTLNNAGGLRENYTVDHTASKFLIDANGHWRRTYGYNLAPDVIAADIQSLLAN